MNHMEDMREVGEESVQNQHGVHNSIKNSALTSPKVGEGIGFPPIGLKESRGRQRKAVARH